MWPEAWAPVQQGSCRSVTTGRGQIGWQDNAPAASALPDRDYFVKDYDMGKGGFSVFLARPHISLASARCQRIEAGDAAAKQLFGTARLAARVERCISPRPVLFDYGVKKILSRLSGAGTRFFGSEALAAR
jgi:hypothetical protein